MKGIGIRIKSDAIIAYNNIGNRINPIYYKGYKYLVFTTSGTMNVKYPIKAEYMLLAGGGSGGVIQSDYCAGGGGAGGIQTGSLDLNIETINIIIGAGGAGKTANSNGNNGANSTIGSYVTAIGGGGGATVNNKGLNGGCGGGGSHLQDTMGKYKIGGMGSQGFNGGYGGCKDAVATRAGGGGGGISQNGQDARYYGSGVYGYGGNGGSGSAFNDIFPQIIDGSILNLPFNRFGGGGGGCGYSNHHGTGVDGGTAGVCRAKSSNVQNNTGGGSGGGHGGAFSPNPAGTSGNGGSGLCIIRFPIQNVFVRFYKYIKYVLLNNASIPYNLKGKARQIYKINTDMNLLKDTKFLWCGQFGTKVLQNNNKVTTIYSIDDNNSIGTQSNINYAPYYAGTIAPNEMKAIRRTSKYGANTRTYITHSYYTFNFQDSYTLIFMLNWDGMITDMNSKRVQITNVSSGVCSWCLNSGNNYYSLYNNLSTPITNIFLPKSQSSYTSMGKQVLYHFVKTPNDVTIYRNGIKDAYKATQSAFSINSILNGYQNAGDVWCYSGEMQYYQLLSKAMSQQQVLQQYNKLKVYYPQIETCSVNNQQWNISNLDITNNSIGNCFKNLTQSNIVVLNSNMQYWMPGSSLIFTKSDTLLQITKSTGTNYYISTNWSSVLADSKNYKWFELTFQAKSDNSTNSIKFGTDFNPIYAINNPNLSNNFQDYKFIIRHYSDVRLINCNTTLPTEGNTMQIKDMYIKQYGWNDMDFLYSYLRNSQSYTHINASIQCAAWCYYNNDPDTYVLYGKLYNKYAKMSIQSNPIPIENKNFNLPYITGSALHNIMKISGSLPLRVNNTYWTNSQGTNYTSFSAIGSGYRDAQGNFQGLTNSAIFWQRSSNPNDIYSHSGWTIEANSTIVNHTPYTTTQGYAIRLVNNDTLQELSQAKLLQILQGQYTRQVLYQVPKLAKNCYDSITTNSVSTDWLLDQDLTLQIMKQINTYIEDKNM